MLVADENASIQPGLRIFFIGQSTVCRNPKRPAAEALLEFELGPTFCRGHSDMAIPTTILPASNAWQSAVRAPLQRTRSPSRSRASSGRGSRTAWCSFAQQLRRLVNAIEQFAWVA